MVRGFGVQGEWHGSEGNVVLLRELLYPVVAWIAPGAEIIGKSLKHDGIWHLDYPMSLVISCILGAGPGNAIRASGTTSDPWEN